MPATTAYDLSDCACCPGCCRLLAIGLYDTGVDDDGIDLPDDTADPHYSGVRTLDATGLGYYAFVGPVAALRVSPNADSIAPGGSTFTTTTTFEIPEYCNGVAVDINKIRILGRFWADDPNSEVKILPPPPPAAPTYCDSFVTLNGTRVATSTTPFAPVTIDMTAANGLVVGTNTLVFSIDNRYYLSNPAATEDNPTSLAVEWQSINCAYSP